MGTMKKNTYGGKREGAGRPPFKGKEARLLPLLIRITKTEKAVWTKAAKAEGLGLGPWVAAPRRAEMERGK
jgi:hypothetical protein